VTTRADGQFNSTVVKGSRRVVLMNKFDIAALGLRVGDRVMLSTAVEERKYGDLQVMEYDIPEKCVLGYYPECNVLIPLWHHAKESKVPTAKSVPVRIALQHRGDG
jgi:anaerobic selenocysteine-containing dehydrogenase